jgi:hypothetical protein
MIAIMVCFVGVFLSAANGGHYKVLRQYVMIDEGAGSGYGDGGKGVDYDWNTARAGRAYGPAECESWAWTYAWAGGSTPHSKGYARAKHGYCFEVKWVGMGRPNGLLTVYNGWDLYLHAEKSEGESGYWWVKVAWGPTLGMSREESSSNWSGGPTFNWNDFHEDTQTVKFEVEGPYPITLIGATESQAERYEHAEAQSGVPTPADWQQWSKNCADQYKKLTPASWE